MEHREKIKASEEAVDQFQRLQDDLVLHILEKVSDVEWLCRCFMVSKRFSSLAPRVQTLSLNGTLWDSVLQSCSNCITEPGNFHRQFTKLLAKDNLVRQPLRLLRYGLDPFPSSPLNFLDLVIASKQFRSLNIELFPGFDGHDDSVFEWRAKFTPVIDSVTFLHANSLSRMMESEEASENEIAQTELHDPLKVANMCAIYGPLCLGTLSRVLRKYPMLDCVTFTDRKNKGVKLCLGGEKLAECRNTLDARSTIWLNKKNKWNTRIGDVPVLQLPISGYVMKGVTIVTFTISVNDYEEKTVMMDAMLDAFAEEQGPLKEAVMQILEKHKDRILGIIW